VLRTSTGVAGVIRLAMGKYNAPVIISLSFVVGFTLTAIDLDNIEIVTGAGCLALVLLLARVSYRRGDYIGIFIPTMQEHKHEFSRGEKVIGYSVISLLFSPYLFMLVSWVGHFI
jgi:hypothetical protein